MRANVILNLFQDLFRGYGRFIGRDPETSLPALGRFRMASYLLDYLFHFGYHLVSGVP